MSHLLLPPLPLFAAYNSRRLASLAWRMLTAMSTSSDRLRERERDRTMRTEGDLEGDRDKRADGDALDTDRNGERDPDRDRDLEKRTDGEDNVKEGDSNPGLSTNLGSDRDREPRPATGEGLLVGLRTDGLLELDVVVDLNDLVLDGVKLTARDLDLDGERFTL